MGHCLTSKQQHLADSIALNALKILKSILTELFSTGEIQVSVLTWEHVDVEEFL